VEHETRRIGLLHGIAAYGLWGIVAAYWKLLEGIDPIELVAHRAVWGLLAFGAIAIGAGQWRAMRAAIVDPRVLAVMALSSSLLAVNWGVFVGATITGRLLDASLGYFINPLVSVALGMIVLRERMRRLQWIAIGLAAVGVAQLALRAGEVPWIALVLASTFGLYGLVRKIARVEAVVGSTIETVLMAPVGAIYLAVLGGGVMNGGSASTIALLAGTGVVTAVPLVLFASAARRLPLATVGFLQYLAPTGQFVLAATVFGEPLASERLLAFVWIWAGLGVFSVDLWRHRAR
jgi:chloramphenicol-sensitive protein RarD